MAAAKVGGILANSSYPADFIYQNLQIEANVIQASHLYGVKKLLFLGSSCIYPKTLSATHERRLICSPATWNPPTNPMRWLKSPA